MSPQELSKLLLNGRTRIWLTRKQTAWLKSVCLQNPNTVSHDPDVYYIHSYDNSLKMHQLRIAPNKAGVLAEVDLNEYVDK